MPARSRATLALTAVVALAAGATGAIGLWGRPLPSDAPIARFVFPVPDGAQLTLSRRALAVSPDGTRIAYVADGKLFLRALPDLEPRPIAGGDPAVAPAFSPDGQSIAFWAEGVLKRLPVTGGVPIAICDTTPSPFGIHWSEHGIVFVEPGKGVMRVSEKGGTPQLLVPAPGAILHGPQLLPGGDTLLFTLAPRRPVASNFWEEAEIVAQSLATGERTVLVRGGSDGRYLPTGHLAYMVEGTMMAVPFDPTSLEVQPGAVSIVEGIRRAPPAAGYAAQLDVSSTGILVYVPGPARSGRDGLFVSDRKGNVTPLNLPAGTYGSVRVSPEGKRLAVETSDGKHAMVSLYDLAGTSSLRRLTFGGNNRLPIWSADGARLAFQSDREGDLAIFWQPVTGGPAERLTKPDAGTAHVPEAWLPRGDSFLFSVSKGIEHTLWLFSIRDRTASRFGDVTSLDFPTGAVFSPDGRWVAYQSGEGGAGEATLYVLPFPLTGVKHEIARGGRPVWSPDSRELFYVPGPSLFSVISISAEPAFGFTPPAQVPRRFGLAPPGSQRPYDILPDGRFVAIDAVNIAGAQGSPEIQVVLNWFEELKAKLPAAR